MTPTLEVCSWKNLKLNAYLTAADAITTYSKEVFSFLEQIGLGRKIPSYHKLCRHNSVQKFCSGKKWKVVVYVGRLESLQTPDLLVEAFREVHMRVPDAKLQIVGYGTLYDQIKDLIHEYGLDETVYYDGQANRC